MDTSGLEIELEKIIMVNILLTDYGGRSFGRSLFHFNYPLDKVVNLFTLLSFKEQTC